MKYTKKFTALVMSLILMLSLSMTAFAASTEPETNANLPADAVVLYQDEDVTVYRSESQAKADGISPRAMDYAYAWVNPSDKQSGSFNIEKTFSGTGHVTFKVESSNGGAYAQMTLERGVLPISATVQASNPDGVEMESTVSGKGTSKIQYLCYNNTDGMRLMCWIYG